jgi:lantibiotic modifying enzyme
VPAEGATLPEWSVLLGEALRLPPTGRQEGEDAA